MKKHSLYLCLSMAAGLSYAAEQPSVEAAKPAAAPVESKSTPSAEAPAAIKPVEVLPVTQVVKEEKSAKSPEEIAKEELSYMETFGWMIGQRSSLSDLGLTEKEIDAFIAGLRTAVSGKECPHELLKVGPEMQKFLEKKAEAYQETKQKLVMEKAIKNKTASKTFIEELQKKETDLVKSATGLCYKIINKGDEAKPGEKDTVNVHYEGKLINGKIFDSSKMRGQAATFSLERVIPGFQEGLRVIGKGGKVILYIPSELGYGDSDLPSIPAGSLLIFEVELLGVTPFQEPKKEEAPAPVTTSETKPASAAASQK